MDFRTLLKDIQEETTSGDIAIVQSKVGSAPVKRQKGKKCKKHKRINCQECISE